MKITMADVNEYTEYENLLKGHPNYSIILDCYESAEINRKLDSVNMRLRRLMKSYPEMSFLMVTSTTKGETARRYKHKTGKPGRPHENCRGQQDPAHIHIMVVGDGAASMCKEFSQKYNKDIGRSEAKYRKIKDPTPYFVRYVYRQANARRSYGILDWAKIAASPLS